jgi:UDP-N-acetylglucosamine 2-epimerase (non-hydrolysing)
MKVILVVGARPNFMKAAPILRAIADANQHEFGVITPVLVHTGQHYDAVMSDAFFVDLNLPRPDIHLGVGSGSHAGQTAEIMRKFEGVLESERPDAVVVVGDVNSTVACALVTAKISFDSTGKRPLLAHVEAGLRSFDRSMPEECNRVVTDHLSDLLFVTEESGLLNLDNEGISEERVFFVGNTMIDSLLACRQKARESKILECLRLCGANEHDDSSKLIGSYALLTLHRPANVDNLVAFREILEGLQELVAATTIIFPAHPRTQQSISKNSLDSYFHRQMGGSAERPRERILMIEPLGYLDFLCLMEHAALVITDSGGIQEETTCLGVPCVTVRENTERPITVDVGTNIIAGVRQASIARAVQLQRARRHKARVPDKWDGHAAERIVEVIKGHIPLLNQPRTRDNALLHTFA